MGEGLDIAAWLNLIGVAAFVLKYRVPARPGHISYGVDLQRALSMVRHCSTQLGLNSSRIGVLSFSFGTLVAAFIANMDGSGDRLYKAVDEMDQASFKLNFLIGIYPSLMPAQEYFKQNKTSTPPSFFALTSDDSVI